MVETQQFETQQLSKEIQNASTYVEVLPDEESKKTASLPLPWTGVVPAEVFAGLFWCASSFGMIMTNKLLLSAFQFNAPISLLFFQFAMTVILIDITTQFGILKRDPLDMRIVKIWMPVNVIFVAMIGTGFITLKTLQVPMVTLLKNLTNLLSIIGDLVFFGKRYSLGVWASLALMTLSAGVGSATDLSFNLEGYTWMLLNCTFTAAYALYLKRVLNQVEEVTLKNSMSDITKVYYNHLLGLPWLFLLSLVLGEVNRIPEQPASGDPKFLIALAFSGVAGFAVSYSSIRFMSMTTVTTYVMVGSFNKIPTAVLGWIIFQVKTTMVNVASVMVGLLSGIVFVRAKLEEKK